MGGEEGDANVTGTIGRIGLDIEEDATVTDLYIGTSGGTKIGSAGNDNLDLSLAIHENANVRIANESEFANVDTITYVYVIINNTRYEIEKGKPLSYLSETLQRIKNVEGKEFVKFVKRGTDEEVKEDTIINEDIELTAVYKDKEKTDDSPKTGVEYKNAIITALMVFLFVVLNVIFYKKIMK